MNRLLCLACLLAASSARAQVEKVGFRADNVVLVDGKPFFPIGLYYCGEEFDDVSGKQLQVLRDYGFNTLGFYREEGPTWKAELDRVHKLGLKVWVRGRNGFAVDTPAVEKAVVDQVKKLRDHPALLFWEFQDEPLYNKVSVEDSRKGHRLVKSLDPHHPMLTIEWPGVPERFGEWKGIGDIFGTDLYPIPRERGYGALPNHDITQMRDYLAALRKAHGDKPFLMVLQAWAWDPLKDRDKGWPTVRESRFMAYQSVIHGAKGLSYYGQMHCTKPNSASGLAPTSKNPKEHKAEFEACLEMNRRFWDSHRGFFKELSRAGRIFVLPEAPLKERIERLGKDAALESATRKSKDGVFLMTANADAKERKATFRLPTGSKETEVHVAFENRRIPVKDGTFTDVFGPYEVHVYATTPTLPE